MEKNRIKSIIESLLFVYEKPLEVAKIHDILEAEIDKSVINEILIEIGKEYNSDEAKGLRLDNIANGWQLRTKEENQIWIKKLENIKPIKLSPSALEVLAIIAYKQPVIRAEIDKIRGVDSSHLVKTLMDRNLIKINGRSDLPGKPLQYSTTPDFLEIFGLSDLKDLPSHHELEEINIKSFGNSNDFEQEKELNFHDLIETENNNMIMPDANADEVLEELSELNKGLKIDIDLVQEKVDIIFKEACRKYATQRNESRSRQ